LTVAAPVVDPVKVVTRRVALPPGRKTALVVHAGPCILLAPARVALRAPAAVRLSVLHAQGLALVPALVDLVPAGRARVD
jgi:hypothetical protein